MTLFIVRRIAIAIPVLFGVTLITFLLMHFTAGNYVPGLTGNPRLTGADLARIRAELGLNRPIPAQYLDWVGVGAILKPLGLTAVLGGGNIDTGVLEGNFGRSLIDGSPVLTILADRLPNTIELTGTALLLGLVLAIPIGVLSALYRGSWLDNALTTLSVAGFAIPEFWFCLLVILVFSVILHDHGLPSLPSDGATSALGGGGLVDRLAHLILPASVLAFYYFALWSRFVRSSMIEVISQDYIRTARAKGLSENRVVFIHALRNALASLITLIGLELPDLVGGSLVVEVVFNWPGVGLLTYQRALAYDYTTVMGITIFVALSVIAGNLLADVLYGIVDPRVRYA